MTAGKFEAALTSTLKSLDYAKARPHAVPGLDSAFAQSAEQCVRGHEKPGEGA